MTQKDAILASQVPIQETVDYRLLAMKMVSWNRRFLVCFKNSEKMGNTEDSWFFFYDPGYHPGSPGRNHWQLYISSWVLHCFQYWFIIIKTIQDHFEMMATTWRDHSPFPDNVWASVVLETPLESAIPLPWKSTTIFQKTNPFGCLEYFPLMSNPTLLQKKDQLMQV